ncbi:hypothetical protein BLA60_28780 [Actinophytocola xinjiangensis]|uniref:ATP-dependent DNA helicase RecG n=1 Tax=Actinophytocola xinjiangensis TaxID=485602 RepID=A0A7Z0WHC4_9PSEU|nr:hypothetical protein [Actinophytocola xinjiangensis]OLF07199.1 hypothetical protein BLA60_28780 [Actinophytocola xinjiangensis]
MKRSMMPALIVLAALLAAVVTAPSVSAAPPRTPPRATPVCDPIDPAACLLPFPNDFFTVPDRSTPTGRRLSLAPEMMPRNVAGVPIDPSEWNRSDGFSPGSMLLASVPGVDLARTGAAPITDIGRSLRRDAPVVLIDATTGKRHPYWVELDSRATDPTRQALIVRPAKNLVEGHRYVVALRDLRDGAGQPIPAGPAFQRMLRWYPPSDPTLRARWLQLRPALVQLWLSGVDLSDLHLAWDFTVASTRNLTGRALHMRDEAFAALGDAAPAVTVTSVQDPTPEQDPAWARKIVGTVEVPQYLTGETGGPGSRLAYGPDGRPEPDGIYRATFQCNIPRSVLAEGAAKPLLWGHGLFGSHTAVNGLGAVANESNSVPCGASWLGMSGEDVPFIVGALGDLSLFGSVPDRMQQAYLNALFLGRSMIHPAGLSALPEFQVGGAPALDASAGLGYAGASLGGIQGTALSALGQDFTRSVLIVPATNFSTMLNRASPFQLLQPILDASYPDKLDQQVGFALMQVLWDRGEGNGYVAHLVRDPLPGTPVKSVLLHQAFGDHQVANIATEVASRTLGLRVVRPTLAPGRDTAVEPQWNLPAVPRFPYRGSALVVWDSGTPAPPLGNQAPTQGHDPHGDTGNTPAARAQAAHFLLTGEVIDVCGGEPCVAIPTS